MREGGRSHTHAEAVNNAAYEHLRKMPRHDLEHGPDEVSDQAYSNRLLAAKPVAEGECEDCPKESTELLVMLESVLVTILSSMNWRNTHREGA